MNKILYIDDEAGKGWSQVLKKIIQERLNISCDFTATDNTDEAAKKIEGEKYLLILLDIRFGEKDHENSDIHTYGGFRLLKKIRQLHSINYATPVMVITASNKIWNIDTMLNAGADAYYIKEHPDYASEEDFSRQNYKHLIEQIPAILDKGQKREKIWSKRDTILNLSEKNISNKNIKERIDEKLRMGYGIYNRKETDIEREQLVFNKEILAFLVFWSVLEEISHDFLIMDYSDCPKSADVKIKGTQEYYLEELEENGKEFLNEFNFRKKEYVRKDKYNIQKALQMSLRNEISAILHFKLDWDYHTIKEQFVKPLNDYRNSIDFIHSSHDATFRHKPSDNQDSKRAYSKIIEMLDFLITILS